jgi:hypothetical protein
VKPAAFFLLAVSAFAAQVAVRPAVVTTTTGEQPHVTRQSFSDLEKKIDGRLSTVGGADHVDLLGLTRALYLEGYGVVITSEASLIVTPAINPFRQQMSKAEIDQVHKRKLDHLPALRDAMRELWLASASSLTGIPEDEQVVFAVRLLYAPWEDTKGLPGQLMIKAPRRALLSGNVTTTEEQ